MNRTPSGVPSVPDSKDRHPTSEVASSGKHLVFALTGDIDLNSRGIKQIRALAEDGWRITVLTLILDARPIPATAPVATSNSIAEHRSVDTSPPLPAEPHFPPQVTVQKNWMGRVNGIRFFLAAHRAIRQAVSGLSADCYHASDLYVLPALATAARIEGVALTYDARELYPYVAATEGRPWVRWVWKTVEKRYIVRAGAVFTVSQSISRHLQMSYDISEPVVLFNARPSRGFSPETPGTLRQLTGLSSETPIILHLGQMRKARGCLTLIRAMRHVSVGHLVFLGYGPMREELQTEVRALRLSERVSFLDSVSPDKIPMTIADADVGVTLLENTCLNHRFALPNKLFDYIAAGVPVLASSLPEMQSIVERFELGVTADPACEKAVAGAIQTLLRDFPSRSRWYKGLRAAARTFAWEESAEKFVRAIGLVLEGNQTISRQ